MICSGYKNYNPALEDPTEDVTGILTKSGKFMHVYLLIFYSMVACCCCMSMVGLIF